MFKTYLETGFCGFLELNRDFEISYQMEKFVISRVFVLVFEWNVSFNITGLLFYFSNSDVC